jgi:hypothetical protein
MTSVLVRPRHHTSTPRPTPPPRPALLRECDRVPELFDLPAPASADTVNGPLSPVLGSGEYVTFDDVAEEDANTARFAAAASKAVRACRGCPFLQQCRRDAYERLAAGQQPQGEVVAAVAFNDEGLPEPSIHNKPHARELDQHTLDADLGIHAGSADEYTDWVPADLTPVDLADSYAVDLALDEDKTNLVVSQTYLDTNPDSDADGRIVLSYADEWSVLSRGVASGMTRHRLAQTLGCTWTRASETVYIIGADVDGAFEPTEWDTARRGIYLQDLRDAQALRESAAVAQHARDREVLYHNDVHDHVLDVAAAHNVRVHRRPPPISSRLKRGLCVQRTSSALADIRGVSAGNPHRVPISHA